VLDRITLRWCSFRISKGLLQDRERRPIGRGAIVVGGTVPGATALLPPLFGELMRVLLGLDLEDVSAILGTGDCGLVRVLTLPRRKNTNGLAQRHRLLCHGVQR
jgi:hypothetical protein